MKRLTLDGLRALLPDLAELRPLVDHALVRSEADPARTWSGSGELGTAGDRLVDTAELESAVAAIVAEAFEYRRRLYQVVARAAARVQSGDTAGAAESFLEAADIEEAREEPIRAAAYSDAAFRLARDGDRPALTALALRRRARHRRASGRYRDAESDYEQAFVIAEAAGDGRGAAEALVGAGNVLEEEGRWDAAAERYRRALSRLEGSPDPTPESWHALMNLHVALRSTGALDESLEPLRKAGEIADALADQSATPFLENARGQLAMAREDFEAAEVHLRRAVSASSGARAEITIRLNLAETLFAMGRELDAAEEARRAERRAILGPQPGKLPEVYRLLGRIAAARGVEDAFVLFERALEIIAERGLPELERAQTLQAYGEAEAAVGDVDRSRVLLEQADQAYRSLGIERRRPWADRFDREAEGSQSDDEDER